MFPSGGDSRTNLALKFDFKLRAYADLNEYEAYIPSDRWSGSCNTNDGDYVYSIGGRGEENAVNTDLVIRYDIAEDAWTEMTNLPRTLYEGSCTVLHGLLYHLGGQTGCCAKNRIADIYSFNLSASTQSAWSGPIGSGLLEARHHAVSVNHPNDWILTIGGRKRSDDMAEIVEIFDPQTGESTDSGLRFQRKNAFHALYRYDAVTHILFLWAGVYDPDNVKQTLFDDVQYIIMSEYDAISPTPSPTPSPSATPTQPTFDPTSAPSVEPTTDPTAIPTEAPTDGPTVSPPPSPAPTTRPSRSEEGMVRTTRLKRGLEEEDEDALVDIMETDAWPMVVVIVVFMVLCFCGCMYCVHKRYAYKQSMRTSDEHRRTTHHRDTLQPQKGVEMAGVTVLKQKRTSLMREGLRRMTTPGKGAENVLDDEESDSESFRTKGFISDDNIGPRTDDVDVDVDIELNEMETKGAGDRSVDRMKSNASEALYVLHKQISTPMTPTKGASDV